MTKTVFAAVAVALAAAATPAAQAAPAVPTLTGCSLAYYSNSPEETMQMCDFVATGSRGDVRVSGPGAWGYVTCTVSGTGGYTYGGSGAFRATTGDLCHLHVFGSGYGFVYGEAWTYDI